jgi:hypothetical protein
MKPVSAWIGAVVIAAVVLAPRAGAGPSFGFEGGLSISGLSGGDTVFHDARYGPAVGAYAEFTATPTLSFEPELLVATKGARTSSGEGVDFYGNPVSNGGTSTLGVNVIEIPLLLRASADLGGNLRPSVVVGPAFSFELSGHLKAAGDTFGTSILKNSDIGLTTGIGLDLPRPSGFWRLDVRSNFGLTNVEEPAVGDSGIHNWNVVAMLGYGWKP